MTSATKPYPTPSRTSLTRSLCGFTLLELLIVVGIIAILIGILAPTITLIVRRSNLARVRADLNTIATALEAYKNDFNGNYPAVIGVRAETGAFEPGAGAHVLCRALFGLGPAYPVNAANFGGSDGFDGPGFRLRRTLDDGVNPRFTRSPSTPPSTPPWIWTLTAAPSSADDGTPDSFAGKTYGPYLRVENFRFDTDRGFDRIRIIDHTGSPILYYSASTLNQNLRSPSAPLLAWRYNPTLATVNTPPRSSLTAGANYLPIFNVNDNDVEQGTTNQQIGGNELLAMLGDYNLNNQIDGTEPSSTNPPFLLVARGTDGRWGPAGIAAGAADANKAAVAKSDDITNLP